MKPRLWKQNFVMPILLAALAAPAARGQQDWLTFTDPDSDSVCGVINAANAELVVSPVTGQLDIRPLTIESLKGQRGDLALDRLSDIAPGRIKSRQKAIKA